MREDMTSQVRIRSMEATGPRKLLTRGYLRDFESIPVHQSMRGSVPHYSYAGATRLKPLKRWLEQQVGRPWNSVYAELRARFDHRNQVQAQVLQSLGYQVERDVFFDGDQPRVQGRYGSWAVNGLYVHPTNGLLLKAQSESKAAQNKRLKTSRQKELASRRIDVSDTLQLHCLDGNWYWVELDAVTAPVHLQVPERVSMFGVQPAWERIDYDTVCRDVITGVRFFEVPTRRYGKHFDLYGQVGVYAKRKWQASKREVAQYVSPQQ